MSETSNCRDRLIKYCQGYGLDIGYGGDPITPSAITVDLPIPYTNVGNHPLNLGGDARSLYWFNSNVLDYVFSSHLLEDFEDTEGVLREWIRVLKVGGYLILFCPDEQIYREHCRKTGQDYNLAHKISNFGLAYIKEILLDKFPNMEIVHENPLVDVYSFELVAKKNMPAIREAKKMNFSQKTVLLRNPVYKTIAYYRRHGLGRTVRRVFYELRTKLTSRKTVEIYPAGLCSPGLTRAGKMKKVSFLIGLPRGESKRYRVYNLVEGLQNHGVASCVFYEANLDNLERVMDSNLIVIFRARMSPKVDVMIKKLNSSGIPVVFDVDDLVFDTQYVNYINAFKHLPDVLKSEYMNEVKGYRQVLERCDFVTCTTEFLADKVRQIGKPCFVVPNTINRTQYELAEAILRESSNRDETIKIGYFSGTSTHDRDFLEASGALAEILKRYGDTELHIVGSLRLPRELMKSGGKVLQKPLMPYLELLRYLLNMDINIAPLEQGTAFNDGKSELKLFEAALVEVPTVASRTDSYSKCISDGSNGFLAGSKEEWLQKLCSLIENEELRRGMGLNARKYFIDRFYIENVIGDIIRIYEEIIDR
jgi:glycosyltransferase involved in cell wall biosynthesis/predicted SAM-dependent methyltransferase